MSPLLPGLLCHSDYDSDYDSGSPSSPSQVRRDGYELDAANTLPLEQIFFHESQYPSFRSAITITTTTTTSIDTPSSRWRRIRTSLQRPRRESITEKRRYTALEKEKWASVSSLSSQYSPDGIVSTGEIDVAPQTTHAVALRDRYRTECSHCGIEAGSSINARRARPSIEDMPHKSSGWHTQDTWKCLELPSVADAETEGSFFRGCRCPYPLSSCASRRTLETADTSRSVKRRRSVYVEKLRCRQSCQDIELPCWRAVPVRESETSEEEKMLEQNNGGKQQSEGIASHEMVKKMLMGILRVLRFSMRPSTAKVE
ncbi:hypothetical protein JX265_004807 [Neoarthrinium moseri]|uniref:Uncharacterized protein n=1 Tax=Neoarthrinium moseri TaxID=1658444 RepID=A0A9Q0ASI6_9PEZI|nr:hypothetical protein JX265_004807 [Neoarthrinium moseri]